MARPRGARRISESDERESCINVSGLFVEHLLLRTIMGIRAHPRLATGKTSKGHFGTQSRGCAGQTVRPSHHSISQTSVGKLSILMYSVSVFRSILMLEGSGEAIPSEPPSLARSMW